MRLKNILPLLIFLFFLTMSVSPTLWSSYSNNFCGADDCVNETIAKHMGERTLLPNDIHHMVLFFGIYLLLRVIKSFKDVQFLLDRLYYKYKLFEWRHTKLFCYLSRLFANGILKPKIY